MKVKREYYTSPKELPREEYLSPGSPLCAGCGGLETLRLMHKVIGRNVVVVNAAGCLTLMATFPFTPLRSSWLYTTMGGPSAGAQGIRDALDVLKSRGKLPPDEDLEVLVLAGDGSTYDMGLSATSAAIHRNLNFWYLCYTTRLMATRASRRRAHPPTVRRRRRRYQERFRKRRTCSKSGALISLPMLRPSSRTTPSIWPKRSAGPPNTRDRNCSWRWRSVRPAGGSIRSWETNWRGWRSRRESGLSKKRSTAKSATRTFQTGFAPWRNISGRSDAFDTCSSRTDKKAFWQKFKPTWMHTGSASARRSSKPRHLDDAFLAETTPSQFFYRRRH